LTKVYEYARIRSGSSTKQEDKHMAMETHRAPYSRLDPILRVIRTIRLKAVPDKIDGATLARWDIAEGNAYQILQTLRFLGLIDYQGTPTEVLERLRRADPDEYPGVLAGILRESYDFIFQYFDPSTDDVAVIRNAFFQVEPRGQKDRMEWLFTGLCREAGILSKEDSSTSVPQSKPRTRTRTNKAKSRAIGKSAGDTAAVARESGMIQGGFLDPVTLRAHGSMSIPQFNIAPDSRINPRYGLLVSLLEKLPPSGQWTTTEHELWTQVWNGALQLCVEVTPDGEDASQGTAQL
jgi:Family of unknown function (DUF5343)